MLRFKFFLLCLFSLFSVSVARAAEILTLGDAIVDYTLFVEEEFLKKVHGKKGGRELVDYPLFLNIIKNSGKNPCLTSGGNSVNIMKGLASLGHSCTVIGKIGDDEVGHFFLSRLRAQGVTSRMAVFDQPTGRSLCLVTPDGERTMRTFLGVCTDTSDFSLNIDDFKGINLFHVEGYQLRNFTLLKDIIRLAKAEGAKISFDLGCFEIVSFYRQQIQQLLEEGIDILFCNEEEAKALTGLGAEEACQFLSQYNGVVVVTAGARGCYAAQGLEHVHFPAFSVPVKDTTGAGDLFASGFLHGYLQKKSLGTSVWMGSLIASEVIQIHGAELPTETWGKIKICFQEN